MYEVVLEKESDQAEPKNPLISSKGEVDELASELADGYVDYLVIDISEQQSRTGEAVEECLTHLEEVCSVIDNYRQRSHEVDGFVEELAAKNESLNRLYEQVDAFEQYMFEANRIIDHLDTIMREVEAHKKTSGKMRQIMDYLPKLSFSNIPGAGLLNNLGGLIDEPTTSVKEILSRVSDLEASLAVATSRLKPL